MRWAQLFIFGIIGVAALIGGTTMGLEYYPILRDNTTTQGLVVELQREKSGATSDVLFFPVVEFSTGTNAKVRFRANAVSEGDPAYEVGTTVDVLYDPRSPANARTGSVTHLLLGPLTAWGIGLVIILLSLLLFVKIGRFEKGLKALGSGKPVEKA